MKFLHFLTLRKRSIISAIWSYKNVQNVNIFLYCAYNTGHFLTFLILLSSKKVKKCVDTKGAIWRKKTFWGGGICPNHWRPHRTEFVLRLLWWRFFVKIHKNIGIYSGAEWGVVFSRQNWKSCLCLLFRLNTIQYYQLSIENNYPWRKCCSYLLIFNSIWLLYLSIQLSYFQGRIWNLVYYPRKWLQKKMLLVTI